MKSKVVRQLLEEASKVVDGVSIVNHKLFAELIIRECSKINQEHTGRRIDEINLDMQYTEHFGVKL